MPYVTCWKPPEIIYFNAEINVIECYDPKDSDSSPAFYWVRVLPNYEPLEAEFDYAEQDLRKLGFIGKHGDYKARYDFICANAAKLFQIDKSED